MRRINLRMHSPFEYIDLAIGMGATLSAFLTYLNTGFIRIDLFPARLPDVHRVFLLTVICLTSLLVFTTRRLPVFRIAVLLKAITCCVLIVWDNTAFVLDFLFFLSLIWDVSLYEEFPVNIVFSSFLVTGLPLAHYLQLPAPFDPMTGLLYMQIYAITDLVAVLCLLCIDVGLGYLTYYRECLIEEKERTGRLEHAVQKLSQTNLGYQAYASEAASMSRTEERHRITRDIHDIIGYTFTNNIMMLEAAVRKINKEPDTVIRLIEMARENASSGLAKIRESLYLLRSQDKIKMPGMHRILRLVEVFQSATGIVSTVDFTNFPNCLTDEYNDFVFSFVQESLTNSFLHGEANSVSITFLSTEKFYSVSVSDNGKGGAVEKEGIGLTGMRERLGKIGGILRYGDGFPGFRIVAELPREDRED